MIFATCAAVLLWLVCEIADMFRCSPPSGSGPVRADPEAKCGTPVREAAIE